jgi:chromosome segregation protein
MALPAHLVLINRDGHQFSRFGVNFHASDSADTGILARQREIEALGREARERQEEIGKQREDVARLEPPWPRHDEGLAKLRVVGRRSTAALSASWRT